MNAYLAVDIGASSGRLVEGHLENGVLALREIHRFRNGARMKNGRLCWDVDALFREIVNGLTACGDMGVRPVSVGVDTWGVDYALIDRDGARVGDTIAYRDGRTAGIPDKLDDAMLYARTGIRRQPYNTVYQLLSDDRLARADKMLLMPDYLHYLLTGRAVCEYTIATTTALVGALSREWDFDLIDRLRLPRRLFCSLHQPGTAAGALKRGVAERCGFQTTVVLPPAHDTAAAVLGAPIGQDDIFLSSGTWSLIGAEMPAPILTDGARLAGMTNEGGVGNTCRFLKNIAGMWIFERLRDETPGKPGYGEIAALSRANAGFAGRVDVNAPEFLAPVNMKDALTAHLTAHDQPIPQSVGEWFACVQHSLADSYARAARDIERLCGKTFSSVAVVGGGSRNAPLNEWTARACGKPVLAGPAEGTALGNLLMQMLASGEIASVRQARGLVSASFARERYE